METRPIVKVKPGTDADPHGPAAASPSLDVVTLGEAMALLIAEQPGSLASVTSFVKCTAGAETNVAIGLARLGLRVGWASRLGRDAWGRYLRAEFEREGIDCSHVAWDEQARTGMMLKEFVTDGRDAKTEYFRKGSAASLLGPADLDLPWLTAARHLHTTGVYAAVSPNCDAAVEHAMQAMRAAGRTVSFDTNLRPTLWPSPEHMVERVNALAALAHWVLPGVDEGRVLCGSDDARTIAAFYLKRGARVVVVKLGAEGAWWQGADGAGGHVPAHPVVRVVDTVGAGDAFAAGFISAMLAGRPVPEAVQRAAWMGARAVQVRGDTEGLPTAVELATAGF